MARIPLRAANALVVIVLAIAIVHFATRPFAAGDIYWQLRTGQMILATGSVPATDTFSYTIAGTPWNNHEWGFEAAVALLHRAGGWTALRLMVLALFGGSVLSYGVSVGRVTSPSFGAAAATVAAMLASFKIIPAPQTASMAFFCAAWSLFFKPDALGSAPRVAGLFALMVLWGNTTAEALVFLPFLFVDRLTRMFARTTERRRRTVVLLGLFCVAPMLTPSASSVLEYVVRGTAVNREVNAEFAPIWVRAATIPAGVKHLALVILVAYCAFAVWELSRAGSVWAVRRRVALGALAATAAVLYERNLWLLAIPLAQMVVALHAATRTAPRRDLIDLAALVIAAALFASFCATISWSPALAARALTSPTYWREPFDGTELPVTCLPAVRALPVGARVFTKRLWGSFVILEAPQARVFIDGRNREYPVELHRVAALVWGGASIAQRVLDVSGTTHALTYPGWNTLPALREGAWREVARGRNCAVYARGPQPARP